MSKSEESRQMGRVGRVCLVGAGPGDPGLITVAGLERLRRAEVVVFDALANPALLDVVPAEAIRIDAGKRAKDHKLTQDQINDLLVEHAKAGRFVVRLKGGDPYLFGRGAEEAIHCGRHGVACEVIAGVTSGIAAPMAAGIPVTHRQMASTVTFVTGHEDPTKPDTSIDYAALAALIKAGGTACFYMGVGRLPNIAATFHACGLADSTPVAIIQWGTTPRQRSLRTTLATAAADVAAAGLGPPAIVVIGPVAAIDEPGLTGFTNRPLFGQRIIVTRTRQQSSELRQQLETLGAEVLEAPTIDIEPPTSWDAADDAIRSIRTYNWLVLTSPNGVDALAQRLDALHLDARHLAGVQIAVIGDATERAVRDRLGIRADFVPTAFVAEALAAELIAQQDIRGKRILLLRADIARPALPNLLTDAGAAVTDLETYRTVKPASLPAPVLDALRHGRVDWITFTSSTTVTNLVDLIGDEQDLLANVKTASIGPITSDTLRQFRLAVTVEVHSSTIPGLVDAITDFGRASMQ